MNEIQFKIRKAQLVGLILNIIGIIFVAISFIALGSSILHEPFENTPAATTGLYSTVSAMIFLISGTLVMIYSTVKSH